MAQPVGSGLKKPKPKTPVYTVKPYPIHGQGPYMPRVETVPYNPYPTYNQGPYMPRVEMGGSPYANPYLTAVYGGGGGGGAAGGGPVTWSQAYNLEGAPSWWKGMLPSQWTPETEFAAMVNALMPYLTIEDQRAMGSSLSRLFPDAFGSYSPEKTAYPTPPSSIKAEREYYFQSQQRATDLLGALDKMKAASGQDEKKFGPGYQYLRQLATTVKEFGAKVGQSQMSRRQYINMYSALDPLLAETKGEALSAYGEIARALTQPFMGAGKLINVYKDQSGNWIFGKPNTGWF